MEREQYAIMAQREERHWWYAGMRQVALAVLRGVLEDAPAPTGRRRLLDAGCGTGGTTVALREFGDVYGVDVAWEALGPSAARGLDGRIARGTLEALPFPDASFDVVTSFEVLYHRAVDDDARAFAELRRVIRPGGCLLLRVPAHDWLRGHHDHLVHTRRRYTRVEVARKLETAGFQPLRVTWANSVLFPPAVAKRWLESLQPSPPAGTAEPDLWQPPRPVNALLRRTVSAEAFAIPRGLPLPFGLSVLAVGRAA